MYRYHSEVEDVELDVSLQTWKWLSFLRSAMLPTGRLVCYELGCLRSPVHNLEFVECSLQEHGCSKPQKSCFEASGEVVVP